MSNGFTANTLDSDDLKHSCNPDQFDFKSTEELPQLDGVIGQERATSAISFGIGIDGSGYHIFALGAPGTGRKRSIKQFLEKQTSGGDQPDDWCYVNNFDDRDKPQTVRLPSGRGREFRDDMEEFVNQLKSEVPQAFESKEYEQEQEQIRQEFREQRQQLFKEVEENAQSKDLTLLQTQQGIVVAPVVDDEVISPDEFSQLDDEHREEYEDARKEIQDELREAMRKVHELQSEAKEKIQELDQKVLGFTMQHLVEELKEKYSQLDPITDYLDDVHESLMNNIQTFKQIQQQEKSQQQLPFPMSQRQQKNPYEKYKVNLLVDNSNQNEPPVIYEGNPTYYNLAGRIEHEGQFGALKTDYTMIKSGALHEANGGYLILDVRDLLTTPFAWDALKRALEEEKIKTEAMGQEYRAIQTKTLEPEQIPLDVKVILIGNPRLYYLLYNLDEEFQELFRVKADFGTETDRDEETIRKYAQFVGTICEESDLNHFEPSGVSRLVEEGSRQVSDKKKLFTKMEELSDLIHQSVYWANENGNSLVNAEDVQKAIEEKKFRANRFEEKIREKIEDGSILINTEDSVVGQVNGLSVIPLGDYSFGRPARITARTHAGDSGVVNIERETEMGGQIHNKGAMILSGYLGGQFAQDIPLTLTASLTFEQTYQGVEGDSASSTELYALLSSIAEIPIKQNYAVTGSVNQHGKIQAIGGVNEKIEGFFHVCKIKGLTGDQGVLIPESNVQNLTLRKPVIDAVENDDFHIHPISTVSQGIEILTGIPAGEQRDDGTYPDDTVMGAVENRLHELAKTTKQFGTLNSDHD